MATTSQLERELKSLKRDLNSLKTDLRGLVDAAGNDGSKNWHDLRDRVSSEAQHRAEQLRNGWDHARDYKHKASEAAHRTVEDHPFTTVLAALAGGLLLGHLLGRR
jgi:ElaB/YqjD/DUF883 family membrane-anchored ribosome-binding protein